MKYTSDKKFYFWINQYKPFITPVKNKYEENSLYYDVKVHPQDYLYSMFTLNKEINKLNIKITKHYEQFDDIKKYQKLNKLFRVLPMGTSIAPKYIIIDTHSLISLTITENSIDYYKNIKKRVKEIWLSRVKSMNKVHKKI